MPELNKQVAYCLNVHPSRTLDEVLKNLTQFTIPIKSSVSPNTNMGIGLWLSATTLEELSDQHRLADFRDRLTEQGLVPFTINGFPFGDFHQPIVKHDVYLPTWAAAERLDYTVQLAGIQHQLLPEKMSGTISTLPLGWPVKPSLVHDPVFFQLCAQNLRQCAARLAQLEDQTGRNILICIEPEPGCLIDTCDDLVDFYETFLLTGETQTDLITRRHIGVCHDVCHSAVMFEDQATAISRYAGAGIRIGKIQVSSAIAAEFDPMSPEEKQVAFAQLQQFAEPRYLHQTSIETNDELIFFADLLFALQRFDAPEKLTGSWRIHFHVPIFAPQLGQLSTTQVEIANCLGALQQHEIPTPHFEIETYAWNVLPQQWQTDDLVSGISREWNWFAEAASKED